MEDLGSQTCFKSGGALNVSTAQIFMAVLCKLAAQRGKRVPNT